MRAKVITLRFSPQLGRFDDAPLIALQQKVVLEQMREHLVQIGGEPMLVCVAEWREQPQGAGAALPRAEIAPRHGRAEAEQAAFESQSAAADCPPPATSAHPAANSSHTNERSSHPPARPVGELRAELTEEQRALFDRVRAWRSRTAHAEGAPPYVILTNRQLVELVRQRPRSKTAMGQIAGFGDKKLARHGEELRIASRHARTVRRDVQIRCRRWRHARRRPNRSPASELTASGCRAPARASFGLAAPACRSAPRPAARHGLRSTVDPAGAAWSCLLCVSASSPCSL